MSALSWACLSTPVGEVSVGCSPAGVAEISFGPPRGRQDRDRDGLAAAARQQLAEYFRGRRTSFELPLDWSAMSGTRREVLQVLAGSVGYGQTISYGKLAARAGLGGAGGGMPPARAVGKIMGSNPIPVIVPCHRVLASGGLGGYSGGAGVEVKRWLLTLEGALPPTLDWEPAEPE